MKQISRLVFIWPLRVGVWGFPSLVRGGLTIVAAALLPKCLACLLGYVALLLGLVASAPEICG